MFSNWLPLIYVISFLAIVSVGAIEYRRNKKSPKKERILRAGLASIVAILIIVYALTLLFRWYVFGGYNQI